MSRLWRSTQHDVDFMVKDSKRFADSGGWGYAVFDYDAASDTFKPGDYDWHAAAGERRQVRVRVPHDREGSRTTFSRNTGTGKRRIAMREPINRDRRPFFGTAAS